MLLPPAILDVVHRVEKKYVEYVPVDWANLGIHSQAYREHLFLIIYIRVVLKYLLDVSFAFAY